MVLFKWTAFGLKQLKLHFKVYILSVHTFSGNQTRDFSFLNAMLYGLNYEYTSANLKSVFSAVQIYIYIYP